MRTKHSWKALLGIVLLAGLEIPGCGQPENKAVTPKEDQKLFRPQEKKQGYGKARPRKWPPIYEELFQKARDPSLGSSHVLVIQHGAQGGKVRSLGLHWDGDQDFRWTRGEIRDLKVEFRQQDIDPAEGKAFLNTLDSFDLLSLGDDSEMASVVFGEGQSWFYVRRDGFENEFRVVAPVSLAKYRDVKVYRDLLSFLKTAAPQF